MTTQRVGSPICIIHILLFAQYKNIPVKSIRIYCQLCPPIAEWLSSSLGDIVLPLRVPIGLGRLYESTS